MRKTDRWKLLLSLLAALASIAIVGAFPWEAYHRTDDIVTWLERASLTQSTKMKLEKIQDESGLVSLPIVTVTDFSVPDEQKVDVMLAFGEHARELISSDVGFWFVRTLLGDMDEFKEGDHFKNARNRFSDRAGRPESQELWAEGLLRHVRFTIVIIANGPMRRAVEKGEYCTRANSRGVDLNRNWPFHWDPSPTSGGRPLSEPESRIVHGVATKLRRLRAYVTVHSGEYAVYYPWDHSKEVPVDIPRGMNNLTKSLTEQCECIMGPGGRTSRYLAFGTSMDYFYNNLKVPYSLTLEVYGRSNDGLIQGHNWPVNIHPSELSGLELCLKEFNPDNRNIYNEVVARWVSILLRIAEHVVTEEGYEIDWPLEKTSESSIKVTDTDKSQHNVGNDLHPKDVERGLQTMPQSNNGRHQPNQNSTWQHAGFAIFIPVSCVLGVVSYMSLKQRKPRYMDDSGKDTQV